MTRTPGNLTSRGGQTFVSIILKKKTILGIKMLVSIQTILYIIIKNFKLS